MGRSPASATGTAWKRTLWRGDAAAGVGGAEESELRRLGGCPPRHCLAAVSKACAVSHAQVPYFVTAPPCRFVPRSADREIAA